MRSDRRLPFVGAFAAVTLSACGGGEVTIQVLGEADGQPVPVPDLAVSFLPYDRDSVFEALASQAAQPEPEMRPRSAGSGSSSGR